MGFSALQVLLFTGLSQYWLLLFEPVERDVPCLLVALQEEERRASTVGDGEMGE